ncbi:hypothetical protein BC829DRAFT_438121 [Chytridium lagenaria]|nr:hypothetical protein BC829DRAFT_438121 [Chytridium lagenaria]
MGRVRSPTVSAQPSFDTTKFADLLKNEGFDDVQSAAIIALVSEAVGERELSLIVLEVYHFVVYFGWGYDAGWFLGEKSHANHHPHDGLDAKNSTLFLLESQHDFSSLRRDIQSLERGDFALLRAELQRISSDVAKIQDTMVEEVGRAHGGVRLDVNLEKARILDEAGQLERLVVRAEERIQEEVGCWRGGWIG